MSIVTGSIQRPGGVLFVLCLVGLCFGGSPAVAGEDRGFDTPQAVFEAARTAGAAKDMAELVRLTAPSERPMLAFGLDMGVGMMVEFWEGEESEAMKQRYAEIRANYGVEDPPEDEGEPLQITPDTPQEEIDAHIRKRAEAVFGGVDLEGYVPAVMAIVLEMPEMEGRPLFPATELADVEIDGDAATGTAGDKTITFLRENGRWYLSADAME